MQPGCGPNINSSLTFIHRACEKIFSNGDVYLGSFKGSIPHGKGKYTWSEGTVYEGDWEEGKMTGKGKIIWPSQATYEGDFSGGYLHGFGTFIGSDGSIYRGSWKMNSTWHWKEAIPKFRHL
ncbi:UNVERIFIED_CONTAM: Phosphatidylinositol 4-phosphate 5-kinase [Sesamum radiatum]|uniref:Phosphatidylinositol 4-phosphate 5-kinase n=1 Tax=Sesamum radiatum TaxID=300843 RepID=A0AAW2RW80_SESRA